MSGIFAQTFTGGAIDLLTPDHINFRDVAAQLARIRRYNGAALFDISVARHSINVVIALEKYHGADDTTLLYGLLHDAHDYAVGDIIHPVKQLLEAIYGTLEPLKKVTRNLDRAIHSAAGLPPEMNAACARMVKEADLRMLATEKRDFLDDCIRKWMPLPDPYDMRFEHSESVERDENDFLAIFHDLRDQLRLARLQAE